MDQLGSHCEDCRRRWIKFCIDLLSSSTHVYPEHDDYGNLVNGDGKMRGFVVHATCSPLQARILAPLPPCCGVAAHTSTPAVTRSQPAGVVSRDPSPWSRASHDTIATSAKSRRNRQEVDVESEQAPDEPQIDIHRRAEAISSHLQLKLDHVRPLLRQNPGLALVPLDKLCRTVPCLSHVLGVPVQQALFMAARQLNVLDADPQRLVQQCCSLAAAVELPTEQIMFMASRQPYLLEVPPLRMAAEASKLAAALGCTTRGALQLFSRLSSQELYSVLSMSSSTVLRRLPEVVEALGLPSDSTRRLDMLQLIARNPGLLAASPIDIGRSTDAIMVAFQQSAPLTFAAVLGKCPSLLTYPAEQLLANYQGLLVHLQVMTQQQLLKPVSCESFASCIQQLFCFMLIMHMAS